MCCSALHCVAACCSLLQCVAVCCSTLQCVAACCNMRNHSLPCPAADKLQKRRDKLFIGMLQRVTMWCMFCSVFGSVCRCVYYSVLQSGSVWCSALQCAAVCCTVLQFVAVCCGVLQRGAVWCSVLQRGACVAVRCNVYTHVQLDLLAIFLNTNS